MIWPDREAKRIKEKIQSKSEQYRKEWVDDMKTPSGRIHVGSLRGMVVHDLIFKALKKIGVDTEFSYVFNDMDPMDGMPSYLDKNKWDKYMGFPLYKIPSPEPGFTSFADYFAKDFIGVFNSLNCRPQIIWSHQLYRSGKMNPIISLILDEAVKIRKIYRDIAKAEKPDNWFPYNPVCEKCGRIGTTNVYKWDGKYVHYRCEPSMVKWAAGCGFEGKIEPVNENGKLPWKLDWPAHWKIIGVTVESSGKDHMSSGGSYDMAVHICREVLKIEAPDALGGYEWFTVGGKKMSSSKGIGSSAREVSQILPPEIMRFMQVRTPIKTHLDFNPYGAAIPNLFDDYDRCLEAYFLKLESRLPKGKEGEVKDDFARIIELSEVKKLPEKRIFVPRFRVIVNLLKLKKEDIREHFEKVVKKALSREEAELLGERIKYAKIYIEKYDTSEEADTGKPFVPRENQVGFLKILAANLAGASDKKMQSDDYRQIVFDSIKQAGIKPAEAFEAFYRKIISKSSGPKAGDLIVRLTPEKVIDLLEKNETEKKESNNIFSDFSDPAVFSIDKKVAERYPSIFIGIAVIKNLKIRKSDPGLRREIDDFLKENGALTNEIIGSYPEVQSYRKLYREMGLDWHSKRPSPEALRRRIALKKELNEINTCVDAYNLVVMKNRVSIGAFDFDKLKFPTVLRFPETGEKILLLGDREPTAYKTTDLAYFDGNGGYNIYFNFRDAQRTTVTEDTTNIILNIDGIYGIARAEVEKSLEESIKIITKYCGGTVEKAGISNI